MDKNFLRLKRLARRSLDELSPDHLAQTKLAYALNLVVRGAVFAHTRGRVSHIDLLVDLLRISSARNRRPVRDPRDISEKAFLKRLKRLADRVGPKPCVLPDPGAPFAGNLRLLAETVGLTDVEQAVLQFVISCSEPDMQELVDDFQCARPGAVGSIVASATGLQASEVEGALKKSSRLVATGLITIENEGDLDDRLQPDKRLPGLLATEGLDARSLMDHFISTARPPTLGRDDFAHLAAQVDLGARVLRSALASHRRGINILLYGPTGTGKTELAGVLAADLNVPLLQAGRADHEGESPTARERLTSLLLGNRFLGESCGLLLFDEMEDLFGADAVGRFVGLQQRDEARMSKQWFNLLLESNPIPTIWISNQVGGVDPAFLRRFSYVIEVGDFTAGQRRQVWLRHLGGEGVLSRGDVDGLSQRFALSPAQIGSAVAVSRLVSPEGPSRKVIEAVLKPAEKLLHGKRPDPVRFDPGRYDPGVVNTPVDLEAIGRRLMGWKPTGGPGPSFCLYGPPGSGKSEFVHSLAHRMDRPLVVRRCSDILSKWVGETEANIARAFEEARNDGAVLLFDEADSFLRDRRGAVRSWEVSEVNEFLQQLEAFQGVVACTTNLFRDLDQASLRRFTFKIPFLFLRTDQAARLFARTLADLGRGGRADASVPPHEEATVLRELDRLVNLTPGDFAAAVRRLRTLGGPVTAEMLLAEVRAEAEVKETSPGRVGFRG